MAGPLVPDELWRKIEPLIPERPERPHGGRPPVDDRAALTGILFVLRSGITAGRACRHTRRGSRDWRPQVVRPALMDAGRCRAVVNRNPGGMSGRSGGASRKS